MTSTIISTETCTTCRGTGERLDVHTHIELCPICNGTGIDPEAVPMSPEQEETLAGVNPLGVLRDATFGELTSRDNFELAGRLVACTATEPTGVDGFTRVFACELDGGGSFSFTARDDYPVRVVAR